MRKVEYDVAQCVDVFKWVRDITPHANYSVSFIYNLTYACPFILGSLFSRDVMTNDFFELVIENTQITRKSKLQIYQFNLTDDVDRTSNYS